MEQSEFGSGVVVCLAKFSEHLSAPFARRFTNALHWSKMDATEQQKRRDEALQYPHGDSARLVGNVKGVFMGIRASEQEELMSALSTWANGASDHFYDLDRDKAPQELIELADYMLDLGHGSGLMGKWPNDPSDTWDYIWKQWEEACLAVDRQLGVEPDWGQW